MGEGGDAASADVSAVGTLVWVRRPNGSWWPGRVVSPHEVPDDCPAPTTRSPATPILLLGHRDDGPVFVDWCNLERSKRVKPFRCGEMGLEDCIRRAEEQAACRRRSRRRDHKACAAGSRYARKEDAVLQALDIERARLHLRSRPTTTKPSHAADAQPSAYPSSRKRRTPNDSEDDVPQRMKDLTDIGAAPKQPNAAAAAFADLNRHLPSTSQMKRSKQPRHASPKRKQWPSADQDQPCEASRKRDRSRPLSELCSGDMWKNGFTPDGQRTGSSSDNTFLDKSSSHRAGPVKTEPVDDWFPSRDDGPIVAHLAARSILEADHLHVHQPCFLTKAPTLVCTKQASSCSKDGISSQCDSRNSKKKTTSSVDHEGGNRTRNVSEREHRRERVGKHKAQSNEVVLLEKRAEKSTAAPDGYKDLAAIPNGLDCVGAVLRKHSEIKCKQEPSETIDNHSICENVSVPSAVFELPQLVLPPQHRDPVAARCHVKPVKTLQLNSSLYDVELSAQGASSSNSKGGRVPLVSLMSRSNRRPVVGYPVSVEVLDAAPCPPAPSIDNGHPSTSNSNANKLPKEEEAAAAPQHAASSSSSHRAGRAKAKSRRKASSEDESWRPHTKNSLAVSSPRKMRRLSSFAPNQRGGGGDTRPVVATGEFCRRGPTLACVPLRLVFSRIHEALSYSVK